MQIIITGGGGFLGQKLASALLNSSLAFNELLLVDLKMPARLSDSPRLRCLEADLTQPGVLENVITANTSVVYHLAAIVSSHAEDDFDLGWKVNLDLTASYLRRVVGNRRKFVLSSPARLPFMAVRCRNASPIPPRSRRARLMARRRPPVNCWSTTIPAKAMWMGWRCVCRQSVFARVNQTAPLLLLSARLFVNRCRARRPSARYRKVCGCGFPARRR